MKFSTLILFSFTLFVLVNVAKSEETKPVNEEKHQFQAEINKLLGIIINSLYTDKEIFLRELISNASDALDKIRYESLTNKKAFEVNPNLEIRIKADKETNTLTITDSGIGMTKQDLVQNLGTLAKSGTKAFIEKLSKTSDYNLIGKFGVGFYSAFVVAQKVTVASKHSDDDQYIWESEADNSFTVKKDPRGNTLKRGTEITLHLKDKVGKEYLDQYELKRLISKYSQFTHFPIYLYTERNETKEVPVKEEAKKEDDKKEDEKKEEKKSEENIEIKKEEKEEEKKPKTKKVEELIKEWKHVNDVKPIWTREARSVTEEEYNKFYKSISKDYMDPLTKIHFKQEGNAEFTALLYVPRRAPFDALQLDKQEGKIKLYVRRVFVKDLGGDNFLPRYLNWLTGVIDSNDLPLHISRQELQRTKILDVIKKRVVKKSLQLLTRLAQEEDELQAQYEKDLKEEKKDLKKPERKYNEFYKEFEKNIKLGIIEDESNKNTLVDLLRVHTTESGDELIPLDTYVKRMKKDQKAIYYLSAASLAEAKTSPYLERLKGLEVVLFVSPIDEYMIPRLTEYNGKQLVSISKEGLEVGEVNKDQVEQLKKTYEDLTKKFQTILGSKVEKVVINDAIKESPAVLVAGSTGITANMERIMKAQSMADPRRFMYMEAKKVLEINPNHPVIEKLNTLLKDGDEKKVTQYIELLFDTALLRSGYIFEDTKSLATRVFDMMTTGLTSSVQDEVKKVQENLKKEEKVNDKDEL